MQKENQKVSFKVVEIFESVDGEGSTVGCVTTFLRLHGCNLACPYCDTKYSWNGCKEYVEMEMEAILNKLDSYGHKRVTLTGGEPLIQPHIFELIDEKKEKGYKVNVETNGTVVIPIQYRSNNNIIFTIDYKCTSSGMKSKMVLQSHLMPKDTIKYVVGTEQDLLDMKEEVLVWRSRIGRPQQFVSPVFGQMDPARIVDFVLENKLDEVRVQIQMHKAIWNPEKRGV